ALAFLGVEQNKAAPIAIILHLVIFAPATVFGLYYLAKEGLSLDRLRRIGEQEAAEDQIDEAVSRHEQENGEALAARG
ncbi:MAG TPA: hypothetical protein VLR92_06475, partial [Blastocatellia bacterium]|nr:hypothetical protein [Blastocatellia bacterium]